MVPVPLPKKIIPVVTTGSNISKLSPGSRERGSTSKKKQKKTKLNVPAGRGIGIEDTMQVEDCTTNTSNDAQPSTSASTSARKHDNSIDSSDDNGSSQFSLRDSDSELLISSGFTDTDVDSNVDPNAEDFPNVPKKHTVQMEELKPDVYVIVDLLFNENTNKEETKQFYAVALRNMPNEEKVEVKFFRKSSNSVENDYVFPIVDDVMEVDLKNIFAIVQPVKFIEDATHFLLSTVIRNYVMCLVSR